jgi:hypothetical protein
MVKLAQFFFRSADWCFRTSAHLRPVFPWNLTRRQCWMALYYFPLVCWVLFLLGLACILDSLGFHKLADKVFFASK